MYLLFFEFGVAYGIGSILGVFQAVEDFAVQFFQDPTLFYLIGRITTAVFGIASVGVLYLIGRAVTSRGTALLSALFLSVTYGHVEWCHYVKADIPCTFFTLLSFYFLLLFNQKGSKRFLILYGLIGGLGVATKYYSLILLPALPLVLLYHRWQGRIRSRHLLTLLGLGVGCFLLGFFAGSPFNFLDGTWFRLDILPRLKELLNTGGFSLASFALPEQMPRNIFYYGSMILTSTIDAKGLGILMGGGAILGVIYLIARHRWEYILILSVLFSYLLLTIVYIPYFKMEPRHIIALFPFYSLSLAIFLRKLRKILKMEEQKRWIHKVGVVILPALLISLSLISVVKGNLDLCRQDSRIRVKNWIEESPFFPSETPIILDNEAVPLVPSLKSVKKMLEQVQAGNTETAFSIHSETRYKYLLKAVEKYEKKSFDITVLEHPWWAQRESSDGIYIRNEGEASMGNIHSIRDPRRLGNLDQYRYVITAHYTFDHYRQGNLRYRFPTFFNFYKRELGRRWKLFIKFNEGRQDPGPEIRVYENPRFMGYE